MLKIAYHPIYQHNLPDGHRFPMEKYDLLPQQLIYEGTCDKENFFEPEIPNNKYFFMVHHKKVLVIWNFRFKEIFFITSSFID